MLRVELLVGGETSDEHDGQRRSDHERAPRMEAAGTTCIGLLSGGFGLRRAG